MREIIAARFFGTGGRASAFTIAFQVPNLVANLFANAALSAAFVPVFTELLQKGRKREAFRLASTLFWIMLIGLGAITAFFILAAGARSCRCSSAPSSASELNLLTVGLSQVLFPVILLLGLNGLLVGILQSYDHFTIPAISPAVWNVVIIVLLVLLAPHFHGNNGGLRLRDRDPGGDRRPAADWPSGRWHGSTSASDPGRLARPAGQAGLRADAAGDDRPGDRQPRPADQLGVRQLVSEQAPRAIDNAFRVYMLPQGMFSVAVATVLFPTLSRMASSRDAGAMRRAVGNGMRQINLLMIPAAAFMLVLPAPIMRLLFQRGEFNAQSTHLVSIALFWFAWSLPLRRAEPAADEDLLRRPAALDPDPPGGDEHRRRHHRRRSPSTSRSGSPGLVIGTVVANIVMTGLLLHACGPA